MTDKEKNDFFYVCSLIEYIGPDKKQKRCRGGNDEDFPLIYQ